jgi:hypothetical protein
MKGSNTMAKNTTPDLERREQEFRNHINGIVKERAEELQAKLGEAREKAAAEAKRNRQRKLAREVGHCFLAIGIIAGLYLAESAGLIASVLTGPAYAVAFTAFGWHLCKIDRMRGRK